MTPHTTKYWSVCVASCANTAISELTGVQIALIPLGDPDILYTSVYRGFFIFFMSRLTSKEKISDVVSLVLEHHKESRRSFPWRETDNPYHILVSEYMLQQTQTERVIPKYTVFLKKFPTIRALARANKKEVLTLWSGLGYNRRAVALHAAVKIIAAKHSGKVPSEKEQLLALPGVGDYTAAAVLAFAYSKPIIVIETNIRTVILHHCIRRKREVEDRVIACFVEQVLQEMISREVSPRTGYSAMMDYGAHLKSEGVRVNERSRHYTKQGKFEGSVRQARGALLRFFVAAERGVSEKSLRNIHTRHIDKGLAGLIADGLIEKRRGYYYLTE